MFGKSLRGLNLSGRSQIISKQSLRFGRLCVIPHVSTSTTNKLQRLREGSFCINAPRLFNALPSHLRNLTGVSHTDFKIELDKFLLTVADEPLLSGYTARRRAESNMQKVTIRVCFLNIYCVLLRGTPVSRWRFSLLFNK